MNIIPLLMIDYIFGIIIDSYGETHILKIANIFIYLILLLIAKSRKIELRDNSIIITAILFVKNVVVLFSLMLFNP